MSSALQSSATVSDENKIARGDDGYWCYYVNLYPQYKVAVSQTINVTYERSSHHNYHLISIESVGTDCIGPAIKVRYEEIDFDKSYEYSNVSSDDGSLILKNYFYTPLNH